MHKKMNRLTLLAAAAALVVPLPAVGQMIESTTTLPPLPLTRPQGLEVPGAANRVTTFALRNELAGEAASADVLAGEDALSEVSIDVNPTNPDNQVIVGHDGGLTTMNTFYTMDGGLTWTPVLIGNAIDGLSSGFRFDPTVAFDDDGNVYAGYGARTAAPGGGNQTTLVVCRSSDGGATYPTCALIDTTSNIDGLPGNDKWHLATGPDPLDPAQQNVYIAWTRNVLEASGLDQRIVVSGSTDGGVTFSAPLTINDPSIAGSQTSNLFADPAVGPNGELYVAWHQIVTGQVWLDVSLDGGLTFGTDTLVTTSTTGFKTSIPAQPDRGVHVGPTIDTDRSGGPFTGNLYLTYTDLGPGGLPDVDVLVMRSTDGGVTWSVPMIVNDDVGTNSQFLPWLDVDQQNGLVSTVWYDARNDANNKKVEVFLAVSTDGGASWNPNILVSDNPSDQSTDNPDRYLGNFLEYIGVASLGGLVFPVWADNSLDPADLDYFTDQIRVETSPTADAGPDQTVECAGFDGATVTLDGSGSSDPEGDPLTYTWREGGTIIAGPTSDPIVDVLLALGVHVITLTVDDGTLTDTDEVVVTVEDTAAPTIVLLGANPLTLECGVDAYVEPGATVTDLCDPDPSLIIDASAVDPSTVGTYDVLYDAADASGNPSSATRSVIVGDTLPPVITVATDPIVLWPPNHAYRQVAVADFVTAVADSCDLGLTIADVVITSASSDEPEDAEGGGDGSTLDDIVIAGICDAADLRKERQGAGNGRVYTLDVGLADATGNVGVSAFQVHAPHDVAKALSVDDGPVYTVPGCEP